MANVDVPRGFLVVPQEDGKQVPFLIKVRNDDVIWTKNELIEKSVSEITGDEYKEFTLINPGATYRLVKNDWSCEIQSDGFTTMTKQFKIDGNFDFYSNSNGVSNHTILESLQIDLPLFVVMGSYMNAQSTIIQLTPNVDFTNTTISNGKIAVLSSPDSITNALLSSELLAAVSSVSFPNWTTRTFDTNKENVGTLSFYGFNKMDVRICSPIYKFPNDFITAFEHSRISITIKGFIPAIRGSTPYDWY